MTLFVILMNVFSFISRLIYHVFRIKAHYPPSSYNQSSNFCVQYTFCFHSVSLSLLLYATELSRQLSKTVGQKLGKKVNKYFCVISVL